jgi:hypothetical protein
MVEGDVFLGDEAKTMQAGIKDKSLALRQKLLLPILSSVTNS